VHVRVEPRIRVDSQVRLLGRSKCFPSRGRERQPPRVHADPCSRDSAVPVRRRDSIVRRPCRLGRVESHGLLLLPSPSQSGHWIEDGDIAVSMHHVTAADDATGPYRSKEFHG
jgi:hypothetical protein